MRSKALYIFFFIIANQLFAQQPVTIQLTEKDGLPDIEFYDILEDKNGFIWLAADKGLYRYNGKSFVNFTHSDKRGLSVFGLYEDESGKIWCNNVSGQFFYVENDKLTLFTDLKDELKGQLPEFIIKNKELTAFSGKGIYKINIQTKKRSIIRDETSTSTYYRNPFEYKNQVYFSLSNQIKKLSQNKIKTVFSFTDKDIQPKNNAFCNLGTALLFSGFYDGKQHFFIKSTPTDSFTTIEVPIQLIDKTIVSILKEDNFIWFCTNQGVIVCDWENEKMQYKNTYLPNEYITRIIKDKNNNFWFSSLRNGVFVMPNIYIKKIQLPEITKNITTMAVIDKSHIVFGTTEGTIGILNIETLKCNIFHLLSKTKIWQIIYNQNFNSVFINQENQSYIWDLSEGKIYRSSHFTSSKAMVIAQNNTILNASFDRATIMENPFLKKNNSIIKKEPDIPVFTNQTINPTIRDIHKKRAYTCFYSMRNNTSYVGFVDDLVQFDSSNKQTVIRYKNKSIFAIDLAETSDGTLWVSTFKDGILGIKNKNVIYNLTVQNGLLSNETGKLKSDENQLWITTQKGLQVFNVRNSTFMNITKNDGLESYSISDIEIIKDNVYVSSNKGIFTIEKNKSFKTLKRPEIYFTEVNIQDNKAIIQNDYKLGYDKNAIKISFNSNGFQTSESITYYYRLIGLNNNWLSLEKGTDFVRYSSLPSGNFTFEVKAENQNGILSKPISITILIETPFWQKWWFYIVALLPITSLVWFYFKNRLQSVENEKQVILEKAETDKEFLFSELNSIQEYIITNKKEMTSSFLVKFSALVHIYLEHSKKNEIYLEEELKTLRLYLELEKDRFESALDYTIIVNKNLDITSIKIPSLFIQPYVENALKHGLLPKKENRKLEVSFQMNKLKDGLTCTITDNGIGRKASAEMSGKNVHLHQSDSTKVNQKRIELINETRIKKITVSIEDLHDENFVANGTKVTLIIPF